MSRMKLRTAVCMALTALLSAWFAAERSWSEVPPASPPELRSTVDAMVAALSTGDADGWERLAQERFTADALSRHTPEQRRQFVARVHGDFGTLRVTAVRPTDIWGADVEIRGSSGAATGILHVELDPAPPHRLRELGLRVEQGGGGEGRTQLPELPALGGVAEPRQLARLLDPYLSRLASADLLSGVVLVALHGQPLYARAFGLADREQHIPNTVDTRFNVASIGKQFTHVAIGQLLAQKKIALDDTIAMRLPGYPNADAARKVTIGQLLEHRAGIPDIFDVVKPGDAPPRSNHEWFLRVAPEPLEFEPGTQFRYCNGCYVVLGEIVAAVAGVPYEDYLALHVFAPAGMTATAFLTGSDREEKKAVGYTRAAGRLEPTSLGAGGRGCAAGGVFATATDLLAYDNALREHRLLDRQWTSWMLGSDDGSGNRAAGALGVGGGAPGTNAVLESDGAWTIVVVTNRDPRLGEDLGTALAKALRR
jgi:CubicO group peptidase (beta-lactamase class C family)